MSFLLFLSLSFICVFASAEPDFKSNDPYRILDVSQSDSFEVVQNKYRRLARMYHPDINPNLDQIFAQSIMSKLNPAWDSIKQDFLRKDANSGSASSRMYFDGMDMTKLVYEAAQRMIDREQNPVKKLKIAVEYNGVIDGIPMGVYFLKNLTGEQRAEIIKDEYFFGFVLTNILGFVGEYLAAAVNAQARSGNSTFIVEFKEELSVAQQFLKVWFNEVSKEQREIALKDQARSFITWTGRDHVLDRVKAARAALYLSVGSKDENKVKKLLRDAITERAPHYSQLKALEVVAEEIRSGKSIGFFESLARKWRGAEGQEAVCKLLLEGATTTGGPDESK